MDLFKLFGTVIVETKEAIDALDETSDAAKETSDSIGDLGNESKKSGKTAVDAMNPVPSKFAAVAKAGTALVSAVVAIGTAMVALAENTREYRLEMGKLETAFDSAGHTTEAAKATYQELYSILGETDRAVEASQHIAKLCETEAEMKAMTDACIGAFALFDDSLPIEGLMEAANETAKTGQLTGVLTDALNWAGSSEEEFQKKLDACNTERERAALITEELIALYADSAEAYKKNNKDVIAATSAQEKLTAATARWGEVVEPVVTMFKEGLAASINFAADAFEYMIDPAGAAAKKLVGTAESSEQAKKKIEELRAQLVELHNTPPLLWTEEHNNQVLVLMTALDDAEKQYNELAEAERLAAEEATVTIDVAAEATAQFSSITDQFVSDAQALFEKFAETYEGIHNKVSSFFAPFEKASISVQTNIYDMMSAMQSQIEFNNTYSDNLQALKEYGLGSLSEAFQSYGAEGAAYAQAIVSAVEQAGGATTAEGQAIIQGFSDINQQVTESENELAQTMTLMNGMFETELQDLTDSYGAAIDALDKSAEANTAAVETFEGFLQGMNAKLPEIMTTMNGFGQQITAALQSGIASVSIPIAFQGEIPGHETGLDYVPYDNYLAYLHKGEAVLTAEEASAWRTGSETSGVVRSAQDNRMVELLGAMVEINQEMLQALLAGKTFQVGEREFARLVKQYA